MFSAVKRVILKVELLDAPEMSFANSAAELDFKKAESEATGSPHKSIVLFARNWARLMEKQMQMGNRLDDDTIRKCEILADSVNREAGTSYIFAKSILMDDWKYGQLLQNYN